MFGLISAGISLAGAGMSAIQALQSNKAIKDANNESKSILQQARNRKEQNAFSSVQVNDPSALAFGQNQSAIQEGIRATQGMGQEGVGQVSNIVQAGLRSNIEAASELGKNIYERDVMKAEAQQGVNEREIERDFLLDAAEYEQSNQKYNDATEAKSSAIEGVLGGLGSAVGFAKQDFEAGTGMYKYKKNKTPKSPTGLGTSGASF
jgi:hypothetical protein